MFDIKLNMHVFETHDDKLLESVLLDFDYQFPHRLSTG